MFLLSNQIELMWVMYVFWNIQRTDRSQSVTKVNVTPNNRLSRGSGCGSVGRAVCFDTRGPQFDSSHWQIYIEHLFLYLFIINCIKKTKINKKGPRLAHFLKKKTLGTVIASKTIDMLIKFRQVHNCFGIYSIICTTLKRKKENVPWTYDKTTIFNVPSILSME